MMSAMKLTCVFFASLLITLPACGAIFERGRQLMICHRTANRDAPENTLIAIQESKNLGCDAVELDISRTLDGVLVLLHDGPIDRVSSGSGEIEKMLYPEFALYDSGAWFNSRFAGNRHARFLDAVRLAKDLGLKIELDIKSRGIASRVYEIVRGEGMLDRVSFGGHSEELPQIAPDIKREPTASWRPGMRREEVAKLQGEGKFVVASFSANNHELDFPLMRSAVAAGVDALSTDHPRLAADALGRSLEQLALGLVSTARQGKQDARLQAIFRLAGLRDLPLAHIIAPLLWDDDAAVSRAAAVALLQRRDRPQTGSLIREFGQKPTAMHAGANIAWLAGMSADTSDPVRAWLIRVAGASTSEPLLVEEALRALARIDGPVPADLLQRRLQDPQPLIRGAAAKALARHQPDSAKMLIAAARRLEDEIYPLWKSYAAAAVTTDNLAKARTTFERPNPGKPGAPEQIAKATELYRAYQNVVSSLASLHTPDADRWLHQEALRVSPDFSGIGSYIAATQLWDRVETNLLAPGFEQEDPMRRDRAEWTLQKRGPAAFPALRALLASRDANARLRAAQVLAWDGDQESKPVLARLAESDPANRAIYEWCMHKLDELARLK
jgi:glycerophosphoryl diester phosphodiesterase